MPKTKSPLWIDLTVEHAENIQDFYTRVAGWESKAVDMGGYEDYAMTEGEEVLAGICHARGVNAGIPPVWIPYFEVQSLEKSLQTCQECGGIVICPPRSMDPKRNYAVIQDPSGAVCAIWAYH